MASEASVVANSERLDACIIIAGNRGSGKSTALNNIFNLSLKTAVGPTTVTANVEKNTFIREQVTFTVLDTPGGAELKEKSGDIEKHLKGVQDYTVLLCLRVDAGNRVNDSSNIETIKTLQSVLGREVWKKCVILFTYSDSANEDMDDSVSYKHYINECSRTLNKIINEFVADGTGEGPGEELAVSSEKSSIPGHETGHETGAPGEEITAPQVKSVFEIDNFRERNESGGEIIAFPVGAKKDCSSDILPGILDGKVDWTDLLFIEVMRKTGKTRREAFILLKYSGELAALFSKMSSVGSGVDAHGVDDSGVDASEVDVSIETGETSEEASVLVKYSKEFATLSKMSTFGSRIGSFFGAATGALGGPQGSSLGAEMGARMGVQAARGAAIAIDYSIEAIHDLVTILKSVQV